MTVRTVDFESGSWSPDYTELQREAECGKPESDSFRSVTSSVVAPLWGTRSGEFTVRKAYSDLGWNESIEAILKSARGDGGLPEFGFPAGGGAVTQGEEVYLATGFRVPTGWTTPRGWGLCTQVYQTATATAFGGPTIGIDLRGAGTVNKPADVGAKIAVRSGPEANKTYRTGNDAYWFDLPTDSWVSLIIYLKLYASTSGALKVWKRVGAEADFSVLVDEPAIPTFQQRADGLIPGLFIKQGLYRMSMCNYDANGNIGSLQCSGDPCQFGSIGTHPNSVLYIPGVAICDTLDEARAAHGLGGGGSPPADADVLSALPALAPGDVRYGNATVLSGRGGKSANRKRVTRVTVADEVDVHTLWEYIAPDNDPGTEHLKLLVYDDDGGSGEPGTRKIVSVEKTLAVPFQEGWFKRTISPVVRLVASDFWGGSHSDVGLLVLHASEQLNGASRSSLDTYSDGPTDPFGTPAVLDSKISFVIEGTPTGGGGDPPVTDTTAPTLVPAQSTANRQLLTLVYSEPLDVASVPALSAFSVEANTIAQTVSTVNIVGDHVLIGILETLVPGQIVTVTYSVPGANRVQDVAGNDAAALTDQALVNTSILDRPAAADLVDDFGNAEKWDVVT